MAKKSFHHKMVAIIKPIPSDKVKLTIISFNVTKQWLVKLLELIKLLIVFIILLGDEKRKVLIRFNLLSNSHIKKNIIIINIWFK